jgi:hypothetical protein
MEHRPKEIGEFPQTHVYSIRVTGRTADGVNGRELELRIGSHQFGPSEDCLPWTLPAAGHCQDARQRSSNRPIPSRWRAWVVCVVCFLLLCLSEPAFPPVIDGLASIRNSGILVSCIFFVATERCADEIERQLSHLIRKWSVTQQPASRAHQCVRQIADLLRQDAERQQTSPCKVGNALFWFKPETAAENCHSFAPNAIGPGLCQRFQAPIDLPWIVFVNSCSVIPQGGRFQ